jgi:hypothetical protein
MTDKRVLLVGDGYVGSRAKLRMESRAIQVDVINTREATYVDAGYDAMIFTAWPRMDFQEKMTFDYEQRVLANLWQLWYECSKKAKRSLFISSCQALDPRNKYAYSKKEFEHRALRPWAWRTPNATVVRLSTVFGPSPRFRPELILNRMMLDALTKRKVWAGGPELWRPHVSIRRVCNFITDFVEGQVPNGLYNEGKPLCDFCIQIGTLARLVADESGSDSEVIETPPVRVTHDLEKVTPDHNTDNTHGKLFQHGLDMQRFVW